MKSNIQVIVPGGNTTPEHGPLVITIGESGEDTDIGESGEDTDTTVLYRYTVTHRTVSRAPPWERTHAYIVVIELMTRGNGGYDV